MTVFFYCSILFGSTFFVWVSEKGRTKIDRSFFLWIALLLVFIPSAIRYDIGTDYLNYVDIFEDHSRLESYKYKEFGFYFINWLFAQIGAGAQWPIATFAFVFTLIAFKGYPRKNAWVLHFLFFSMLWFFSFNGVRQAVALSFSMLSLFYFFEKRYFWSLLSIIFGSIFHQSALLVLLIGLFSFIPFNIFIKIIVTPLIFVVTLVITFVSISIVIPHLENILNFIGLTKYASYFDNSKYFIERGFGSGLGTLIKVCFSIYIVLNTKFFLKINKRYWLLILLTMAYAFGLVLASKIVIFDRMADVFSIAPIVGGYLLVSCGKKNIINHVIVLMFAFYVFLAFFKAGFGVETDYNDPKRNPYQTIFHEQY